MENEDAKIILAKRLIALREELGLSQEELAEKIGITRQSLSLYEKSKRTINIDILLRISRVLKVSADYLLGVTDNRTTNDEIKAVCQYTGLSEKAAENIRAITRSGGNANILLECEEFKNIVELLNKIKIKTVIDIFWTTRTTQITEVGNYFSNVDKQTLHFIQQNYAESITLSISQQAKDISSGRINSEDSIIIWEFCLQQREMRKLLDDIESNKPEYKVLFAEYDNSVEEHLKEILAEKEKELSDSIAENNNELEQNIKALKQLIDFYQNRIRKE